MSEQRGISEQEAQRIFGEEHKGRFRNCFEEAWRRWGILPAEARKDFSARSRASIVYDFAAAHALKEFDGVAGVAIVDQRDNGGYLSLVFGDTVVVRLKKFRDEGFGTCGIATEQQQRFAVQEPPLSDFPTLGNIVVGYLLDELETSISTLAIASNLDGRLQWSIDITEPEEGLGSLTRPLRDVGPGGPTVRSTSDEQKDAEQSDTN